MQTPAYVLIGISEILASITGLEYAFTKAPPSMKSLVTSIFLLQNAFGSAIGIGVVRAALHPNMVTFYACLSGVTFAAGTAFWFIFRGLNNVEEELNQLDEKNEEFKVRPANEVTVLGRLKPRVGHHDGEQNV